jgi:outer membrane cobalamin receptor
MKKLALLFFFFAVAAHAQSRTGELRVQVLDPEGLGVKGAVLLVSEANDFRETLSTDAEGRATAKLLPFGIYKIQFARASFAPFSGAIEIASALPTDFVVRLSVASATASIVVHETQTLVDPHSTSSIDRIGADTIGTRTTSLPGRSLQDLVDSQPGWIYEGNAVLHPRGSEYQTQFVVDGIPLTDNRSPSFGPEIEADDVESLNIYTAGIPAEYGRKMGGVVEVNTLENTAQGLHGQVDLSGGGFDTAGGFGEVQYSWGKNLLGVSADGNTTDHYLNPVVPQNYTNSGQNGDFSIRYERDFTSKDRLRLTLRHEFSSYDIPNEQVQQAAGQLQTGDNSETLGIASYEHIFSPNVLADFRAMYRDNSDGLNSNPLSTPVIAFQDNGFHEAYVKGTFGVHRKRQEFQFGFESDNLFLHENFSDIITDPTQFDDGTPITFSFTGSRPDLEQGVFAQDTIRLGKWTVVAGLRWDHYQLLVNQSAFSPRVSVGRYVPSVALLLHASFDRVFQTPSFENILLSSTPEIQALNPNVLRLPVQPSRGDYFEIGFTKAILGKLKLDGNIFRRQFNNYADDDQLLNTAVSFPIAFQKAILYGAEGKLDLPAWRRFSGFASYSYIVGNAWFPVTGGLFLGDDAVNATTQLSGHFPDSQDQRNTLRSRLRYQLTSRVWLGAGVEYGSGLPFDFDGTYMEALAEYGQQVVDRIDFADGRIRPTLSLDALLGADLYTSERLKVEIQADGQNLNDRLNIIDFGGLFSGNAIGPARSAFLRLQTSF